MGSSFYKCPCVGSPWVLLEMELQQDIQVLEQDALGNRGPDLGLCILCSSFLLPFLGQQFVTWLNGDLSRISLTNLFL